MILVITEDAVTLEIQIQACSKVCKNALKCRLLKNEILNIF